MRTFDQIATALRVSAGVISVAAQKLGVHRQRVYEWISDDPALQAVRKEIVEETLDLAEGKLLEHIGQGSEKSIHYFLDRIGRHRGYGNKTALIGSADDVPVAITNTLPDLSGTSQDDRDALRAILERAAHRSESGSGGASPA